MRAVLRILGVSAAAFFTVIFVTATVLFVKKVWFGGHSSPAGTKHVAVIDVAGVLTSSTRFLRELEEKLEDKTTKALVVRIDSPGGLVAPSQEIYEALRRVDKTMPVIVSMGALAASGGYYAALGGRKIYANPGTLTASIGVIMEFMNTERLYEWAKVERFEMTAGKLKAAGTDSRPMTPEERAMFKAMLDDIHAQFRNTVKERRKLTEAEVELAADGRVMTGAQAKAAKLVDVLGTVDDAVVEAKKQAGLPPDAKVEYPETSEGILKRMLFGDESKSGLDQFTAGSVLLRELTSELIPGWRVMLLAPVR